MTQASLLQIVMRPNLSLINMRYFNELNKLFHSNLLMLKYEKTYFLQFLSKTDYEINLQVSYKL